MDFLKRQLFMIICGVVAAGSIALGVVGYVSMSSVKDEMSEAAQRASRLQRVLRGGVNPKSISAQERRIAAVTDHHEKVREWAYGRNRMEPLLPKCFPDPDRDTRLAFRRAYFAEFDEFLDRLDAGTVATPGEIKMAEDLIVEEAKMNKLFGVDESEAAQAGEAIQEEEDQPVQHRSGLLTDHGARTIPAARANLIKARGMRCYATLGSFEIRERQIGDGISPGVMDMWDAQVSLWVQQSVVDALVRVNDRVAEEIRQAGQTAWVGRMPLKELISIRTVYYYVTDASEPRDPAEPGGSGPALPPESADEVFTHTVSNDLYDVVQFTVKMVVDAREVPTIVSEICKDNFHTLLRIAFEDVSTNPQLWLMNDKIYGSDPTVQVVMDFETVFFGELYRLLMPDEIRDALGLPEREE